MENNKKDKIIFVYMPITFAIIILLTLLWSKSQGYCAGITAWKIKGKIFGSNNQMFVSNPTFTQIITGDSLDREIYVNQGTRDVTWYLKGNAKKWNWNGSEWVDITATGATSVSITWNWGSTSNDTFGYVNFDENVYWQANWRGHVYEITASNSNVTAPIEYNSDIIATVGKLFDDRVSFTIKVPHGFDISTLSLNADITYTLPSNQYVTDLVTDLRGIILDKRYKPIVNSTYKKTWGHSYTTRYRYNVTHMNEITEHEESEIFGDTYYYSIPLDILELGSNALNDTTLSNINNYTDFVDGLVTAGYVSRVSIYPYTSTTQGVIKIIDTNEDNDILVNYSVPKLESDVTNGDISAAQTQAYINDRNADIDRRLQEYVYNPNIEAGQNIVEKLNSIVNTVTGMIGTVSGVGAMFALFFTCLPAFVLDIISFTIISLCIISIYKALRG